MIRDKKTTQLFTTYERPGTRFPSNTATTRNDRRMFLAQVRNATRLDRQIQSPDGLSDQWCERTAQEFNVTAPDDMDSDSADPEVSGDSAENTAVPSSAETGPSSFVGLAVLSEGALAVLGWGLGVWSGLDWTPMLRGTPEALLLGVLGGIGLVALHVLLMFPGGARNPLHRSIYEPLRAVLRPQLRDVRPVGIVLLAVASGVGEEVLFRGWLQTQTGIGVASVLFGACHVWGKEALPYGLYATGMGVLLGILFEHTGHLLWAPVLAHAVNNLLGFLALKYDWPPSVRS